jgi:hypothetical protein
MFFLNISIFTSHVLLALGQFTKLGFEAALHPKHSLHLRQSLTPIRRPKCKNN